MIIEFYNINEIRMGSPYRVAERVILKGCPNQFAEWEYQDKYAYDSTRRFAVLIKWDISEDNIPGFRPVLLIEKTKATVELDRIAGCCRDVAIKQDKIIFEVFKESGVEKVLVRYPHHISV